MKKLSLIGMAILLSTGSAFAAQHGDSDVAIGFMNPKQGATVSQLYDKDNLSRWFATFRVKGSYKNFESVHDYQDYVQLNARLRGKTYITDRIGIIGDFWFRATENYRSKDGVTVNPYDDFDEGAKWEQYRFGIEDDYFGSLIYGKHTATWALFAVDLGANSLYRTQGDAGNKNSGKFIYKNQFHNNLFLNASYDRQSHIVGFDIGYQTADIYSYRPNDFGIYLSAHNGQPMIGASYATKTVIGNVDIHETDKSNSDSNYARNKSNLYTYSLSGFYNYENYAKLAFNLAYSEMADDESASLIRERGWASEGLGFSGTLVGEYYPSGLNGIGAALQYTYDEIFGNSVTPQITYWFKPGLRAWIAYDIEEKSDNVLFAEFQWDF